MHESTIKRKKQLSQRVVQFTYPTSIKTSTTSSLSDILEEHPDPKYFLSPEQTVKILSRPKNYENKIATRSGQIMGGQQAMKHMLQKSDNSTSQPTQTIESTPATG